MEGPPPNIVKTFVNICCQLHCVVLLRFGRRLICLAGSGLATLLMGAVGGLVLARDAGANQH